MSMACFLQSPTMLRLRLRQPSNPKPLSPLFSSPPPPPSHAFGILKIKTIFNAPAAVPEDTSSASLHHDAARRLYIGNIPRNLDDDGLRRIVEQHGAVHNLQVMYDKYSGRSRRFAFATMDTVEDANAVIDNLDGTEIGGRKIKVNVTQKPLDTVSFSALPADESQFVDSGYKVYVGNLAKTVTSDVLKNFFSEKGNVVSAKVQRDPGTSKSSGYGFVSYSSEEEADAAISAFNNAVLEGQKIRVNKA